MIKQQSYGVKLFQLIDLLNPMNSSEYLFSGFFKTPFTCHFLLYYKMMVFSIENIHNTNLEQDNTHFNFRSITKCYKQ